MSPEFREDFVLDFDVPQRFFVESESKTRRFRFGVFQLDVLSGELSRRGTLIKLQVGRSRFWPCCSTVLEVLDS